MLNICRRVSELTARRYGVLDPEVVVGRLNRLMTGWANYFHLGQVSPAYVAIDRHATRRLRRWLAASTRFEREDTCASRTSTCGKTRG